MVVFMWVVKEDSLTRYEYLVAVGNVLYSICWICFIQWATPSRDNLISKDVLMLTTH